MTLKEVYYASYDGMSKEYEEVFKYKILSEKKNLKLIQNLISKQTPLYPRLHLSLRLVLEEITKEAKLKDKLKLLG